MSRPDRRRPAARQRRRTERPTGERLVVEPLVIERVVAGGDGLARGRDGKVVFVSGALPGESVEARIVSSGRDFARAEVVSVVEASPARRQPPCAALERGCGGCDWQHADADAQLTWKAEIVREALRRTARLADAQVSIGGAVPPWGYRTSMRFSTDAAGRLSLRRARSHDGVRIDRCHVAHELLSALLDEVEIPGAEEVSLRVSAATGAATVWWQPAGLQPVRLPDHATVGAEASLVERVHGVPLRVSAGSFFQSGPAAAELLVDTVIAMGGEELASARHVVDAYGGVGLFAVAAAPSTARVTVVEGSGPACADARVNLAGRDAVVVADTVESWAGRVDAGWPVDVLVADPSRQGLGAAGAPAVARLGAPLVVLVSCDPVSMARDTVLLQHAGYRHDGTTVVDLFPQTHHVEAVTRFVRSG